MLLLVSSMKLILSIKVWAYVSLKGICKKYCAKEQNVRIQLVVDHNIEMVRPIKILLDDEESFEEGM